MNPDQILSQVRLESEALLIAIIVIGIGLLWLINRKLIGVRWREWRIQHSLNRVGSEQIRNFSCPDGLDGHYIIDRLALVQDAILIISYRPYSGNIYCAERISEWTQVVGLKSFKFPNPLFELENQITSLKLLTGNAALRGYLFFNHSAEFPKGHPPAVLHPDNIPQQYLSEHCASASADLIATWEALKSRQSEALSTNQLHPKT
jgi:hypothetical protein